MAQSSVMDDFTFRKSQRQYKVATDTVLRWLRTVTGQPESTSVSYHKRLASVVVQAGIFMPPHIWDDLCRAINLRQECKHHHEVLGSNDKGHAYILAVLEDIHNTCNLAASSAPWKQPAIYETPVSAPAPIPQCIVAPITPPPPPSTMLPVTLLPPPPPPILAPYGWPPSPPAASFTNTPVNNTVWPAPQYMGYDFHGNIQYTGCQYPQPAQQPMAVQQHH